MQREGLEDPGRRISRQQRTFVEDSVEVLEAMVVVKPAGLVEVKPMTRNESLSSSWVAWLKT